jgi:hypothetical protein
MKTTQSSIRLRDGRRRYRLRALEIRGHVRGVKWGPRDENAVWLATMRRRRFIWRNHDALFIALGRFRLQLMKAWRNADR